MGVTEKELSKLLETGAVASNIFIPKFAAQLNKEFAGGAEAASKTFAAASERLGNAFARIGEAVAASGLLDHLGKMLDKLTGIIAAGPNAADALRKVVQAQSARDLAPLGATGFPIPTAGNRFLDDINRSIQQQEQLIKNAEARLVRFAGGNAANEATQRRFVLQPLQDELARLQADKATLLTAIGNAAGQLAGQNEGLTPTSGISNRYARAQDLTKALQAQAEDLAKALAALDVKATLTPGSAIDILEEKIKVLDAAMKALQGTLATNKDLLPLLKGTVSGAPSPYRSLIEPLAAARGIDPRLIETLVQVESNNNPNARNPTSSAKGLGQFIDSTAAQYGIAGRQFEPEANLRATVNYMADLLAKFGGNVEKALTAYGDKNTVQRVLAAYQGTGAASGPSQLDALTQQRARLQLDLDAAKDFQKEGKDRFKDLDIFGLTLSPEEEATLKENAKAQHERIKAYAETLDIFGLEISPEQEKQIKLIQKSTEALRAYQEQLELSGGALDVFGRATKTTAEARAVVQAEGRLGPLLGTPLEAQALQVLDRTRKAAQEATPLFRGLKEASEDFANSFLSTIEQVTSGGIKSFKQFADSVIQDLLRIAQQKILAPALSQLFNTGLKLAIGALGFAGGGTALQGPTESGVTLDVATSGSFATGGYALAGRSYLVGERGPEIFTPDVAGQVMPPRFSQVAQGRGSMANEPGAGGQGNGAGRGVTVQGPLIVIQATDAGSFLQSRGQVDRQALALLQNLQRNS